jgi:hypothetical protein
MLMVSSIVKWRLGRGVAVMSLSRFASWGMALTCIMSQAWANDCVQLMRQRPDPDAFYVVDEGRIVPLADFGADHPLDLDENRTIYYYTIKYGVSGQSISSAFHVKLLLERKIKSASTDQPGELSLERYEWDKLRIDRLPPAALQQLEVCRRRGWTIEAYEHFHAAPDRPRDDGCLSRVFHRKTPGGFDTLATNEIRHKFAFGLEFEENYLTKAIASMLTPPPARAQTIDATLKEPRAYDSFVSRIRAYRIAAADRLTQWCFPVTIPSRSNISSVIVKAVDFGVDPSNPLERSVTIKVK